VTVFASLSKRVINSASSDGDVLVHANGKCVGTGSLSWKKLPDVKVGTVGDTASQTSVSAPWADVLSWF